MRFEKIENNTLDNIDLLETSLAINSLEHRNYYTSKSSIEHYRLLSYISITSNNISLLDVGTYKGCSALAFSINPKNMVYSFDVRNHLDLNFYPKNVNFIIDDITKPFYRDIILESKYILLDTIHDGVFETIFYDYLKQIKYNGILLLDDIKLNDKMAVFWNSIDLEKYDISKLGHITGTGVVYFKKQKK